MSKTIEEIQKEKRIMEQQINGAITLFMDKNVMFLQIYKIIGYCLRNSLKSNNSVRINCKLD